MSNLPKTHNPNIYARGLTLIESLVALLILSIGLLGLAGLQVTALRENQNSYFKTQAIILAHDMADRMRANLGGVDGELYKLNSTEHSYGEPTCDPCSATDIAKLDAYQWLNPGFDSSIPSQLPKGEGIVTANADGTFTITVMWDGDRQGNGFDCNGDRDDNLECFSMEFTP